MFTGLGGEGEKGSEGKGRREGEGKRDDFVSLCCGSFKLLMSLFVVVGSTAAAAVYVNCSSCF